MVEHEVFLSLETVTVVTQYQRTDGLSDLSAMFGGGMASAPPPEDPSKQKRRRRNRRIGGIVAAVVVVALLATYADLTLTTPVGAAAASVTQPHVTQPADVPIAMPQEGESAISISGGDAYLGSTADGIYKATSETPEAMASISKLITALVVLQARPLGPSGNGPRITFTAGFHALYDHYYELNATIAAMPTGSSMTEYQAIDTMLVASACNYAATLDQWAFGTNAAFLGAARSWLRAHGLTHTVMVEPTGIDARNVSTPSDLIALGKLVMANPALARIVGQTSLTVPGFAPVYNTNDLIGVNGIDGIKTGTLGGSDLLFSAKLTDDIPLPLTVTGVVLGGASRATVDEDVRELLTSISADFHNTQLGTLDDVVGTYSTPWGAKAKMVLGKTESVWTWSNAAITASMKTTTLKTGKSGETVGSVTWKTGTTTITAPVLLQGSIKPPTTWWRLTHPFQVLGK
jgi:D-alanyl-D-alanine carboxypeptidase (penicillin-binding protein 5/6)